MTISQKIDAAIKDAHTEYPPKRLTASRWHECDRGLYLNARHAKSDNPTAERIRARGQGTKAEDIFCDLLEAINIKVVGRQSKTSVGDIDGRCKIGSQWVLNEFKQKKSTTFNKIVKHGCEKAAPQDYAAVQMYMLSSTELSKSGNRLESCLYLIENKNTNELYDELIPLDEFYAKEQSERMKRIETTQELPPQTVYDWACKMCQYKELCGANEIPLNSCGTCVNRSEDGSCTIGDSPCDHHVYNPALMELAGYPMLDINHDLKAVKYERFWNSSKTNKEKLDGPVLSSVELYNLQHNGCEDEQMLQVIDFFDAEVKSYERT